MKSRLHVQSHCSTYKQRRAALCAATACLPGANPVPKGHVGIFDLLRDGFMVAEEAATASDAFPHAVISSIEALRGVVRGMFDAGH